MFTLGHQSLSRRCPYRTDRPYRLSHDLYVPVSQTLMTLLPQIVYSLPLPHVTFGQKEEIFRKKYRVSSPLFVKCYQKYTTSFVITGKPCIALASIILHLDFYTFQVAGLDWGIAQIFKLTIHFAYLRTFKIRCEIIQIHLKFSAQPQQLLFEGCGEILQYFTFSQLCVPTHVRKH